MATTWIYFEKFQDTYIIGALSLSQQLPEKKYLSLRRKYLFEYLRCREKHMVLMVGMFWASVFLVSSFEIPRSNETVNVIQATCITFVGWKLLKSVDIGEVYPVLGRLLIPFAQFKPHVIYYRRSTTLGPFEKPFPIGPPDL